MAEPTPGLNGEPAAEPSLVVPLSALDADALSIGGGKAVGLARLVAAGLPVPAGFCVTTRAYDLVTAGTDLDRDLAKLARTAPDDAARLAELAAAARHRIEAADVPAHVSDAIRAAYRDLGAESATAVAVRSSATTEDLPSASFAGQQETFLNVIGEEAVLEAVRACWASLWTDRAVSYRASQHVDHASAHLAVVVQRMVPAAVAGVLFTADPLSGRRDLAVMEASPGLGEAVVSGSVNPDHFTVDRHAHRILERRPGDKRVEVQPRPGGGVRRVERAAPAAALCLDDDQVLALAALGDAVEDHLGGPQDIEWAIDGERRIWLLQARPITTLYPLPEPRRTVETSGLRVYLSVNVVQGYYAPFTPMGGQALRVFASSAATFFGYPPTDVLAGPPSVVEAGQRLFVDLTPLLRSSLGQRILRRFAAMAEARSGPIFEQLVIDPRLAAPRRRPGSEVAVLLGLLIRSRFPLHIARALVAPAWARRRALRRAHAAVRLPEPAPVGPNATLGAVEKLFLGAVRIPANMAPVIIAGLGSHGLAGRLLGDAATEDELQVVLRGLPHNPTTEMDLALWEATRRVAEDPEAGSVLRTSSPESLARGYRDRTLPGALQRELTGFLDAYGHRSVGEIDVGVQRWSEDPAHVIAAMAGYLRVDDPSTAPDVQFRRSMAAGEAMARELARRAHARGAARGRAVAFLLDRTRKLAGVREAMKFHLILLLAEARSALLGVGAVMAEAGLLEAAEDVFFLTLPEAGAVLAGGGVAGDDPRDVVRRRRQAHQQERQRRRVPRILLSDGTEPAASPADPGAAGERALRGTPVSPGEVTAAAHVVHDPRGARLAPGEVLVAASTDPGWTPLFLTAGGLVMEMGGVMSHGAVVAREYGIPAVVGVPEATDRVRSGQLVTVDGTRGLVHLDDEEA